jgi:uncharacterized protein YecT (DUF1311 family)
VEGAELAAEGGAGSDEHSGGGLINRLVIIEAFEMFETIMGGLVSWFIIELVRRTLLPQTEEYLIRFLPARRRLKNIEHNLQHLEIRAKLIEQGLDPSLAAELERETSEFTQTLERGIAATQAAFVETEVDRLGSFATTQAEMNQHAFDSLSSADRLLESRLASLLAAEHVSAAAKKELREAQSAWKALREKDAKAEAMFTAEGGSMEPAIRGMAMRDKTIERLGWVEQLLKVVRNQ